jgi:hypothetical protein
MRTKKPILENPLAVQVLDFITSYRHPDGGLPPTLDRIAIDCDLTIGYVSKLIKRLSEEGHLVKNGRRWYGADIPNRVEIESAEAMQRARARMMKDYE